MLDHKGWYMSKELKIRIVIMLVILLAFVVFMT